MLSAVHFCSDYHATKACANIRQWCWHTSPSGAVLSYLQCLWLFGISVKQSQLPHTSTGPNPSPVTHTHLTNCRNTHVQKHTSSTFSLVHNSATIVSLGLQSKFKQRVTLNPQAFSTEEDSETLSPWFPICNIMESYHNGGWDQGMKMGEIKAAYYVFLQYVVILILPHTDAKNPKQQEHISFTMIIYSGSKPRTQPTYTMIFVNLDKWVSWNSLYGVSMKILKI